MVWDETQIPDLLMGDRLAFSRFFEHEWSHAVRTCQFIVWRPEDAQDAAQDAFISLYRSLGQLRDPQLFRSWFYRILIHSARARLRARRRQTARGDSDIAKDTGAAEWDGVTTELTMLSALNQLSERERIVAVLWYFGDLTDREAAIAAGMTLGVYKWCKIQARRKLAAALQDEFAPELHMRREGTERVKGS